MFLKNRNIFSKIKRSKVTVYAALTFPRFIYHNSAAEGLLFTGKTALLMKNSFFFSKMAGDHGISLLCFFEEEVNLEF